MKVMTAIIMLSTVFAASFNEYLSSNFGQMMIENLNREIEGFYHDLSTTISDLKQLDQISLPYRGVTYYSNVPSFKYQPDEPMYRLKQNHKLALWNLDPRWITFTFNYRSGNCSDVDVIGKPRRFFGNSPRIPSNLVLMNGNQTFRLKISRMESLAKFYLSIPENCELDLTGIERRVFRKDLFKHSNRNNRPVELVGLVSRKIHNWNRFNYLESLEDFPQLTLINYNESIAEFRYDATSGTPFVVPQDWHLLFDKTTPSTQVRMLFRKSPDCGRVGSFLPFFSCREIDHETIEIEKGSEYWMWMTRSNCEFQLLQMTQTLQLIPGTRNAKLLKYGMTRENMHMAKIRLNLGNIVVPGYTQLTYIEMFRDFGKIYYREPGMYTKRFYSGHVIPQNFEFPLPIHFNDVDSIFLQLETWRGNCDVKIYQQTRDPVTQGSVLRQSLISKDVRIQYQLEPMREKYRRIYLHSPCRLTVKTVKIKTDIEPRPFIVFR